MIILGINVYHGDASAAIVVDGQLVAAAEEERFTRIKHCAGFPAHAVRYCLDAAGVQIDEVDHIAIPRKRNVRLLRKAWYALRMPQLALDRLRAWGRFGDIRTTLAQAFDVDPARIRARFHFIEHHVAHIASAFFVSPFERAALLSLDGLGDFASAMWGFGEGNRIYIWGSVAFPHSVGMYYTAVTQYLGLRYFRHHVDGPTMTWAEGEPQLGPLFSDFFVRRFGPLRRCMGPWVRDRGRDTENRARPAFSAGLRSSVRPDDPNQSPTTVAPIERRHENLAATLQARLEEVVFHQWNALYRLIERRTGLPAKALAYAGGVAFNCVANGQIFNVTPFEDFYIQPAAGDAGLAIGAAFYVWHQVLGKPRSFVMNHAYWGPEFSEAAIRQAIDKRADGGLRIAELPEDELVRKTAQRIAEGKVVGWFQGRMEWGPRALGNRSIVVDPRRPEMKDVLNRRVKHREPFRPFAPSILEECTGEYFQQSYPSPFMLMAYRVRPEKRGVIPAPTHVDGTGRLQTVSRPVNPLYWRLIDEFGKLTGVPVLLNTSFNENEPIVCTPEEALDCFLRTHMDVLAIGRFLIER
ncbi:MAG: carbamoyltransferase [Acidobacteria bacterium]|nr:carbamoyltransferase [Acidobacteriota bacterium]MDW7984457.1 carbamoyltransferase C-terminal domain-containing protein [Acidobacteriota bacterium]